MNTPVAIVLFNRPNHVRRVLERVAEARPPKLFLIADGPRNAEDKELCAEARSAACSISWQAEVHRNFSEVNLGDARRVSSGLDWVFARVPEAIILEDDCLPGPDFFAFCEEMLRRYRQDSRIGIISGDNFVAPAMSCPDSYYFSKYAHIWGWATWRRTWSLFDFEMRGWPKAKSLGVLNNVLTSPETAAFWTDTFDRIYNAPVAWDARLVYTCLINNLLNVMPAQNLVSNIGWGADASHSLDASSPLANMPIGELSFPLRHPEFVYCWTEADEATEAAQFRLSRISEVLRIHEEPGPLSSFAQKLTTSVNSLLLQPGQEVKVPVRIENPGPNTWASSGEFPVNISYKWLDGGSAPLPIEGERTPLPAPLPAGDGVSLNVRVIAPCQSGQFALRITAVQEGVAWFMTESNTFLELPVTVI